MLEIYLQKQYIKKETSRTCFCDQKSNRSGKTLDMIQRLLWGKQKFFERRFVIVFICLIIFVYMAGLMRTKSRQNLFLLAKYSICTTAQFRRVGFNSIKTWRSSHWGILLEQSCSLLDLTKLSHHPDPRKDLRRRVLQQ